MLFARPVLPRPTAAVNIGPQLPPFFKELASAEQQPHDPQMTALPHSQPTANNWWTQGYKGNTFASKWAQLYGTVYVPELPGGQAEARLQLGPHLCFAPSQWYPASFFLLRVFPS